MELVNSLTAYWNGMDVLITFFLYNVMFLLRWYSTYDKVWALFQGVSCS